MANFHMPNAQLERENRICCVHAKKYMAQYRKRIIIIILVVVLVGMGWSSGGGGGGGDSGGGSSSSDNDVDGDKQIYYCVSLDNADKT